MFRDKIKTILGRKQEDAPVPQKTAAETLKETIREKRKSDPLIGSKLGGSALAQRLISAVKEQQGGVHIETLLCLVGSLAGYSAQASVRQMNVERGIAEEGGFVVVSGKDGKKYFFGDAVNKPLAEDQYCVWSLAAGIATHLGCQQPVKIDDIFRHVATTVGTPEFGIPRIPEGHRTVDLPSHWVKTVWPQALAIVQNYCESPSEWPVTFGFAIQEVMTQAKGFIDPCLALSIVMECAIPMSKADAKTL